MSFSLGGVIRERARTHGDKPVFIYQDRTVTFAELNDRASRVVNGLKEAGVGAGDRVAFLDKNCLEYFDVLFGGGKINAVNVAVNWRLAPPEMAYTINDAQAKVLFVGEEFLPQFAEIEDKLQTIAKVVVLGKHPEHESYDSWIARFPADDEEIASGPDEVCMQLYTSGTTGLPKGAMLTNSNFDLLHKTGDLWDVGEDDVSLVVMPLFHIAGSGWALVGVENGCTAVLLRDVDPNEILRVIPLHKVSISVIVPAVIQFLLIMPQCAETDFSSLRVILYGASPISTDVLTRAMETFGCGFMQLYGLTETTGGVTMLAPEDHDVNRPELLRSCGKPFPWVEMRVVDPDTLEDVPTGTVGEIWFRSGQNMKGYWNLPDATAEAITPDGWFRTGDAGYTNEEGFLFLHDRVKDMVVSGGENVYPAEVENALMSHPQIADVAVIGVPDEKWGEAVKAIVVPTEGSSVTEKDIIDYARERLAGYKCPKSIDFTSEALPRNPSGKLLKRILREPYWAGAERRIH